MKWFKENWFAVLILVLLIVSLGVHKKRYSDYNDKIKAKSDSIALLKDQYRLLDERETVAWELIDNYEINLTSYQDSLLNARTRYVNQNKRHAQEVADFNRMPTDSLYLEYIRWIDTISFE